MEDQLKNGVGERKTLDEIQHRKAQLGKPLPIPKFVRTVILLWCVIERHLNSSPLERHAVYPLAFLGLLAVTLLALLLVALNSASLILYPDRWDLFIVIIILLTPSLSPAVMLSVRLTIY